MTEADWLSGSDPMPMFAYLAEFQASLKKYPPIPPGAPDSYAPPAVQ